MIDLNPTGVRPSRPIPSGGDARADATSRRPPAFVRLALTALGLGLAVGMGLVLAVGVAIGFL